MGQHRPSLVALFGTARPSPDPAIAGTGRIADPQVWLRVQEARDARDKVYRPLQLTPQLLLRVSFLLRSES